MDITTLTYLNDVRDLGARTAEERCIFVIKPKRVIDNQHATLLADREYDRVAEGHSILLF